MFKIELNAQISQEERKSLEFYVKSVLRIRKKAKPMSNGIAIELTKFEEYASLLNQLARIGTFGDVEVLDVTPHYDGKKIAVQVADSDFIWGIFFNIKETPVKTGGKAFAAAEQFLNDFALQDGAVSEGPKINGVKRCYVNAWPTAHTGIPIGRGETFYVFGKDPHTKEKYVAAHTKKSTAFIYYSEAMNESIDLFAKGRHDHYGIAKSYVFDAYMFGTANKKIYFDYSNKNFTVSKRELRSKGDFLSAIEEAKANIRQIDKWLAEDDNGGVQSKLNAAKSHLEVSINTFERWAKNAVSDKAVQLLDQIDRSLNDAKTSEWITLLCQTDGSFQVDCFNKIKTAIRKAGKANELISAMRELATELNYQAKATKSLEKYLTESDDVSGFLETFGDKVGFDAAKHARENGWEFEDYRILNTRVWKDDEGEKCSFLVQKGENGEPFDVLCESKFTRTERNRVVFSKDATDFFDNLKSAFDNVAPSLPENPNFIINLNMLGKMIRSNDRDTRRFRQNLEVVIGGIDYIIDNVDGKEKSIFKSYRKELASAADAFKGDPTMLYESFVRTYHVKETKHYVFEIQMHEIISLIVDFENAIKKSGLDTAKPVKNITKPLGDIKKMIHNMEDDKAKWIKVGRYVADNIGAAYIALLDSKVGYSDNLVTSYENIMEFSGRLSRLLVDEESRGPSIEISFN